MVAWHGYERIVFFSEVVDGELFASTKTGRHYRKSGAAVVREKDSRGDRESVEEFGQRDLIYVGIKPDGAI